MSEHITAEALVSDYMTNEIAADNRYKSRLLEVSGQVLQAGKGVLDNKPYVTLTTGPPFEARAVRYWLASKEGAGSLTPGQPVTVRGIGAGLMGDVLLRPCKVVE